MSTLIWQKVHSGTGIRAWRPTLIGLPFPKLVPASPVNDQIALGSPGSGSELLACERGGKSQVLATFWGYDSQECHGIVVMIAVFWGLNSALQPCESLACDRGWQGTPPTPLANFTQGEGGGGPVNFRPFCHSLGCFFWKQARCI